MSNSNPDLSIPFELISDQVARRKILDLVNRGFFCALLGPPYSGKSQLLNETSAALDGAIVIQLDLSIYAHPPSVQTSEDALSGFFAKLTEEVKSAWDRRTGKKNKSKIAGASAFVDALDRLLATSRARVVLLLDHFESLPKQFGQALLATLLAISDMRGQHRPHFQRLMAVMASTVDLFEPSLEALSPFYISQLVIPNDLNSEQVRNLLFAMAKQAQMNCREEDAEELYDWTNGNYYLTLHLTKLWINWSARYGELRDFRAVRDMFISQQKPIENRASAPRIRLLITEIEQDIDLLLPVLDLLLNVTVKHRAIELGPSRLQLTGVVRIVGNQLVLHNRLFERILRNHFSRPHIQRLLEHTHHSSLVLHYLQNMPAATLEGDFSDLYLRIAADVIAAEPDEQVADDLLISAISRIFNIQNGTIEIYHLSALQFTVSPPTHQPHMQRNALCQGAAARAEITRSDEDTVSVAIPLDSQLGSAANAISDVVLLANFCAKNHFTDQSHKLLRIRRFASDALRNRLRQVQLRQFSLLQTATDRIALMLETNEVLEEIESKLRQLLAASFAMAVMYDAATGFFEPNDLAKMPEGFVLRKADPKISFDWAAHAISTERGLILSSNDQGRLEEVLNSFLSFTVVAGQRRDSVRTIRVYPVLLDDNPLGVAVLGFNSQRFFRLIEDEGVKTLLSHAAEVISRKRLLNAIQDISRSLQDTSDSAPVGALDPLLKSTATQVCRLLGLKRTYVWQVRSVPGQAGCELVDGVQCVQGQYAALPIRTVNHDWLINPTTQYPAGELVTDISSPKIDFLQEIGLEAVPTAIIGWARSKRSEDVLGLLVVGHSPDNDLPRRSRFSDWDASLFSALITQTMAQIENARLPIERDRRLKTVFEISEEWFAAEKEEQLLQSVIELAVSSMFPHATAGTMHMVDAFGKRLVLRAFAGFGLEEKDSLESVRLESGHGFAGRALSGLATLSIPNFDADSRADDTGNPLRVKSSIVTPMIVRGRPIGTISIDSREMRFAFNEADQRWLEMLAKQAAIAIDRLRLIARQEKELDALSETYRLNREAFKISADDLKLMLETSPELLEPYLAQAIRVLGAEMGNIRLCDWEHNQLVHLVKWPTDVAVMTGHEAVSTEEGIIGRVVLTGETVMADTKEELYAKGFLPYFVGDIQSELATRLTFGSQTLGVINLESTKTYAFDPRSKAELERQANALSALLTSMALIQKLSRLKQEQIDQLSRRTTQRGCLKLNLTSELRLSAELRPSHHVSESNIVPLNFERMGMDRSADLLDDLDTLGEHLSMAYQQGSSEQALRERVDRRAKKLGRAFMRMLEERTRSIDDMLRSTEDGRLSQVLMRITTPQQYLFFPFELLCHDDDWLALRYPIVRSVEGRYHKYDIPFDQFVKRQLINKEELRILFVSGSAIADETSKQELNFLQDSLRALVEEGVISFTGKMSSDLMNESHISKQYDIVHIACELEAEIISLLIDLVNPRFVFVSLCGASIVNREGILHSDHNMLSTIIGSGVPAALVYRWNVPNTFAREFAFQFYRVLFSTEAKGSLELASLRARQELGRFGAARLSPVLVNQLVDEAFWISSG